MFDINHLHPMIVHFPIALLLVGFLSDLVGLFYKKEFFSSAGFYMLLLGTAGVVAAYISGDLAGDGVSESGLLGTALENHEGAAEITLVLMILTGVTRIVLVIMKRYSGVLKGVAFGLFFLTVLAVARTGYYGGELVFKHAAGVQLTLGMDFNDSNDGGENQPAGQENEKDVD